MSNSPYREMNTANAFQIDLFEQIYSRVEGKTKITQSLMDTLGCSRASLYRKRTGITPLTTDELIRLANTFSLSIDALRKEAETGSEVVVCTTLPPIVNYSDIDYYLNTTLNNLNALQDAENPQLYFAAKELPLYYYLSSPVLAGFRFYLWSIENIRQHQKFDPAAIPQELIDKGASIAKIAENIKTTEFWLPSSLDNLIGQIQYSYTEGRVSKRVLQLLKEELMQLIDRIFARVTSEQTENGKPYRMILCHYLTLSDGALIDYNGNSAEVMFGYASVNYLRSRNPNLINAFKKGLRYHQIEGTPLTSLEEEKVANFRTQLEEKISSL